MTTTLYEAWQLVGGEWRRAAGDTTPPPTIPTRLSRAQRQALANDCTAQNRLTYVPSSKTTGLLPGWTYANLAPVGNGSTTTLTLSGLHENKIFWQSIQPGAGAVFRNCVFAGPRPTIQTGDPNIASQAGYELTKLYNTSQPAWTMYDCVIDTEPWTIASLNPPGGIVTGDDYLFFAGQSLGIRGGRGTMRNCEIKNVQDGVHVNYMWSSDADLLSKGFLDIQHCWIHAIMFYRGPRYTRQPEGTHSDAIQFHRGKNVTIKYTMLGGETDGAGYAQTPSYNSGEGAFNSLIMLQQEVDNTKTNLVENVEIAHCILGAGSPEGYSINHHYNTTKNGVDLYNEMDSVSLHDLKFIYRADGKYVIRNNTHYAHCYGANNVIITMNPGGESWTEVGPVSYTSGS